jgi:hypothetical protein
MKITANADVIDLLLLATTQYKLMLTAVKRTTTPTSFSTAATADVNAVWSKPTAAQSQKPLTSMKMPANANVISLSLPMGTKTLLMLTATR